MSYGGTCGRCGGLHFGSNKCPYLDEAMCETCGKTIETEKGTEFDVHPNRKFDPLGRPYHSSCKTPQPLMNTAEDLPNLTHTTTLLYKARGGECKELKVVQPLDPDRRTLDFKDLQILAREIAKVLQEDAA